jgi:poly(ribitol-phosphate) beta-N-acetylglucosaminyltransferase
LKKTQIFFNNDMTRTLLSCKDIQQSIYCAPDEIRTCCQRFFVDGKIKGDVSLVSLNEERNVSYNEIISAKKSLIDGINNGTDDRCTGCPLLRRADWPEIEHEKVGTISIENHSVCNMRCTYCSETYYGGVKPKYNLEFLLADMPEVSRDLHIAWGGGEPTLGNEFERLFTIVNKKYIPKTQRVFSNALKYSKALQANLDAGLTSLTTSIDAGSEETFRIVRGAKRFEKVLNNLRQYSAVNPDHVTIKYIFTDDNYQIDELEKFVEKIIIHDLFRCNFLISADFKIEDLNDKKILSLMILYWLLHKKGILAVTFDDHVYKRINEIGLKYLSISDGLNLPKEYIELIGDINASVKAHKDKDIIVWGVGEFSKKVFQSSKNLKNMNISMIVDGNSNRWGESFMGHVVRNPECILESDAGILVASSNLYGEIVNKIISMGISKERIVPTFII